MYYVPLKIKFNVNTIKKQKILNELKYKKQKRKRKKGGSWSRGGRTTSMVLGRGSAT